ncbi:thioredoxin domain-containing protein [Novosphingobium profundi]|uniref:DsbA family protein n=1 Tax=Novosphingobium profundi TaxID=1774954 RepID=UPI001BDB0660|nr:thioredoxin domain-containing protein [Novosphingobium profundi]MBT0669904.1 thioredoxin domain-containing protein [Novosphingobium profundi]
MISAFTTRFLPVLAGLGLATATLAGPALAASPAKPAQASQVTVTGNGSFTLGNPQAPVKVTEFISYTCPHCAVLHKDADAALRAGLIPQGKVALTVSNLVRNPVDIAIALLTACGDPKGFFPRHDAFLSSQDTWLPKAAAATPEQRARWNAGELPDRLKAISGDLGFYPMIARFGVNRAKAEQCLANKAELDQIMAQYKQAGDFKFAGTPGIVVNGKVVYLEENGKLVLGDDGAPLQATQWKDMSQAINRALSANRAGQI